MHGIISSSLFGFSLKIHLLDYKDEKLYIYSYFFLILFFGKFLNKYIIWD